MTKISLLQQHIWNGDPELVRQELENGASLETRDRHGYRPLHFALLCANRNLREIIFLLIEFGARVHSRDLNGWKAVHFAIYSNDETLLGDLLRIEAEQMPALLLDKGRCAASRISQLEDFYIEIDCSIHSWIPLVSAFLPSDRISIWKNGLNARFDMSLVGFEHLQWKRGQISLMVLGETEQMLMLDHQEKVVTTWNQKKASGFSPKELNEATHLMICHKMMSTKLEFENTEFKEKTHWLSSSQVEEKVAKWDTKVYEMENLKLKILARPPHNPHHVKRHSGEEDEEEETDTSLADGFDKILRHLKSSTGCSEIVVKAGESHTVSVDLQSSESIQWEYSLKAADIGFQVRFYPGNSWYLEEEDAEEDSDLEDESIVITPYKRIDAGKDPETGQFTSDRNGTLALIWDNSYSLLRKKQLSLNLRPVLEENTTETPEGHATPVGTTEHLTAKTKAIAATDWFDLSIEEVDELGLKHSIRMFAVPEWKEHVKAYCGTAHMCEDFPFSVDQFLPLIEVLSSTSAYFEKVQQFFAHKFPPGFPVKFSVPVLPSIAATFSFTTVEMISPDPCVFEIPSDYKVQDMIKSVEPTPSMFKISEKYVT